MNETLDSASTLEKPAMSLSYRDTGIQILPPPNGEIYKLVFGRDPIDVARPVMGTPSRPVMGIAAIGRFTDGPQSNPYEPLHGAAYAAPISTQKTYVDSAFQTESAEATRTALMKAKTKASIMAKKYYKVAKKEGYVVRPETNDDMVVHSEQCDSTVRLDKDGNLLEGSTKGRSLPNILGTKSLVQTSPQPTVTAPVQPPLFKKPPLKIRALEPSSRPDSPLVFHSEYGSGETNGNEFVVHDATSSGSQQAPTTTTAMPFIRTSGSQRAPNTITGLPFNRTSSGGQQAPNTTTAMPYNRTSSGGQQAPTTTAALPFIRTRRKWEDTRNEEQRVLGAAAAARAREAIAKARMAQATDSKAAVPTTTATTATTAAATAAAGATAAATGATAAATGAAAGNITNVPALQTTTTSGPSGTKRALTYIGDTDKRLKKPRGFIDARSDSEGVEAAKPSMSSAATRGTDRSRPPVGSDVAHGKSSAGLSSGDSPTKRQFIPGPLYRAPGRRQEQDRNQSSNGDRAFGNARPKGSSAPTTSGERSSSGAIGNSERRTPRRRVEHAPRTSQGPRPTVAAYVPPAMRERARNAGENEEEPKNKLRWFRRSERD